MELIGVGIMAGALIGLGIYGIIVHKNIVAGKKELEKITEEIEQSLSHEESQWVSLMPILRRNSSNAIIIENVTKARANLHGGEESTRVAQTYAFFEAAYAFFSTQSGFETAVKKKITDSHEKVRLLKTKYDAVLKQYERNTNTPLGKLMQAKTSTK